MESSAIIVCVRACVCTAQETVLLQETRTVIGGGVVTCHLSCALKEMLKIATSRNLRL